MTETRVREARARARDARTPGGPSSHPGGLAQREVGVLLAASSALESSLVFGEGAVSAGGLPRLCKGLARCRSMAPLGGSFRTVGRNTRVRRGETAPHDSNVRVCVALGWPQAWSTGKDPLPPSPPTQPPAPGQQPGSFVLGRKTAGQVQGLLGKSGPCSPSRRPLHPWPPPRAAAPEGTLCQVSPSTEAQLFSRPQEGAEEVLGAPGTQEGWPRDCQGGRTPSVEMEGRQAGCPQQLPAAPTVDGDAAGGLGADGTEGLGDRPHGGEARLCRTVPTGQRDRQYAESQLASRERWTRSPRSCARTGRHLHRVRVLISG